MATINILMCGGRRVGKTSIMAAIQKNVQDMFPRGDIVLEMKQTLSLVSFRREQEERFGPAHADELTYIADHTPSENDDYYSCNVYLKDRKSDLELVFTDIPGEQFFDAVFQEKLIERIRNSQVLIIAVDSPHLIEKEGLYHEAYNRAAIITEEIQKAFQGNEDQRMILFTPLKCERYKNRGRMEELPKQVNAGYKDLVDYFCAPERKHLYTVAVTPVITMGGLEFLRFLKPMDEEGNLICDRNGEPLKAVSVDEGTGSLVMNWLPEYQYLTDSDGDHFYAPSDCEQPLIYILLFLIGIGKQRNKGFLKGIWTTIKKLPDQKIMEFCKQDLLDKRKANVKDGAAIWNDPMRMLEGSGR